METFKQFSAPIRLPILIFLLFLATITLAGKFYYEYQKKRIITETHNELSAIAKLKVDQIIQWREDKLGNATALSKNPFLAKELQDFFLHPGNHALKKDLLQFMQVLVENYNYRSIVLIDTKGNSRLSYPASDSIIGFFARDRIADAIHLNNAVLTDFHRSSLNYIHLDLLVPFIITGIYGNVTVGTMLIRVDPEILLFPLINSWPTPSKTSETLLIRTEGDSVVYLNELRHRKHTALVLRFPVSDSSLPAAMAARGIEGMVEGMDYRDVPVLASINRIPDSPWIMIAKVDQDEIYAPLKRETSVIITFVVVLILLVASLVWLWVRNLRHHALSQQYEAEIKQRALISHFDYLLKFANDNILLLDKNWRILEINDRALETYGLTREESAGLNMERLIPPAFHEEFHDHQVRLQKEGNLLTEALHIRMNGEQFPVEISSRYFEVEGHQFIQSIIRDITERKKNERILHDYSARLEVVNQLDHMISSSNNIENIYSTFVEQMHRLMQFDRTSILTIDEEVKNYTITLAWTRGLAAIPQGTSNKVEGSLIEILLKEKIPLLEKEIGDFGQWSENSVLFKEGIHSRMIVPLTIQGKISGFLTMASCIPGQYEERDVEVLQMVADQLAIAIYKSELFGRVSLHAAELEEKVQNRTAQLEAANKELEAFTYSVSHDLRSPLRAISGFAQLLLQDYMHVLDEEGKRFCNILINNAQNMGHLIDDLLAFSHIGRSEIHNGTINMEELVREVYEELIADADKSRLNFKVGNLPPCKGDIILMRQVWINLLSNAIKYSSKREHPEISIGFEKNAAEIIYITKDNGVGFEMEYVKKLFGVFQRLHSSKEFEGTGVGLAIVQRIIQRHGGRVWADSEVDKGAAFYFTIPITGMNHRASPGL